MGLFIMYIYITYVLIILPFGIYHSYKIVDVIRSGTSELYIDHTLDVFIFMFTTRKCKIK